MTSKRSWEQDSWESRFRSDVPVKIYLSGTFRILLVRVGIDTNYPPLVHLLSPFTFSLQALFCDSSTTVRSLFSPSTTRSDNQNLFGSEGGRTMSDTQGPWRPEWERGRGGPPVSLSMQKVRVSGLPFSDSSATSTSCPLASWSSEMGLQRTGLGMSTLKTPRRWYTFTGLFWTCVYREDRRRLRILWVTIPK